MIINNIVPESERRFRSFLDLLDLHFGTLVNVNVLYDLSKFLWRALQLIHSCVSAS